MTHQLKSYFRYLSSSKSRFKTHSPFVFELIRDVLKEGKDQFYPVEIEKLRKSLLKDKRVFQKRDFGAGSERSSYYPVKVSDIARHSTSSKKKGRLLFRLAAHFQPSTVLEFGTALGIGTAYLALAVPRARIYSMEGCPELLEKASQNLRQIGAENVSLLNGEFDGSLRSLLKQDLSADLVFIDGNHRKEAVIEYFDRLLPHIHNDSLVILDDIHWSESMTEAWEEIVGHPRVTVSIDIFHTGLVFFRKESAKQHFVIRY